MALTNTPKDGDFASFLARKPEMPPAAAPAPATETAAQMFDNLVQSAQLKEGETPVTEAELARARALIDQKIEEMGVWTGPLTDEELERQALADPGADGDPDTPE